MGETDLGGNWVLFWWAGPCSVNLYSSFLLMGGAVFPPCCLIWGQIMVEVMKIMATSFKMTHACTAVLNAPNPTAGHCKSGSVSCGITASFSLGPGVYKILFVPFISLFPQSYVSSSGSMKGLMVPPPRGLMPYPGLPHSQPLPLL